MYIYIYTYICIYLHKHTYILLAGALIFFSFPIIVHFLKALFSLQSGKLFYPAISVDGAAEFRVNFGSQPFHCSDFNYQLHGILNLGTLGFSFLICLGSALW